MGISISSGLRLQIPEESEDQEFVELGTRLIEGDVVGDRASKIQVIFPLIYFRNVLLCYLVLNCFLNEKDGSSSTSSTLERVHSNYFTTKRAWFLTSRLPATSYPKIHVSSYPTMPIILDSLHAYVDLSLNVNSNGS